MEAAFNREFILIWINAAIICKRRYPKKWLIISVMDDGDMPCPGLSTPWPISVNRLIDKYKRHLRFYRTEAYGLKEEELEDMIKQTWDKLGGAKAELDRAIDQIKNKII